MIATDESTAALRRGNLRTLVLSRFDGNRAAMAKASGLHPNQVNLMLSSNEEIRRNMSDAVARRIERNLNLPDDFMDAEDGKAFFGDYTISTPTRGGSNAVLTVSTAVRSITVTKEWLARYPGRISDPENLYLAVIVTDEMAPALASGELVIVDGGINAIVGRGCYILVGKNGAFLRQVEPRIGGEFVLSVGSREHAPVICKDMSKYNVVGRVLTSVRMPL